MSKNRNQDLDFEDRDRIAFRVNDAFGPPERVEAHLAVSHLNQPSLSPIGADAGGFGESRSLCRLNQAGSPVPPGDDALTRILLWTLVEAGCLFYPIFSNTSARASGRPTLGQWPPGSSSGSTPSNSRAALRCHAGVIVRSSAQAI